jgi:predicted HTH transcriptional regulator
MLIAELIAEKTNGFVSFSMHEELLRKIVYEVSMLDLDVPPKNKLRKVIFKLHCGLAKEEKLSIVGQLIGRSNKIHPDDIYACMIDLHDMNKKITIRRVSEILGVSSRTVHRYMCTELKKEKELLNRQI